MSYTLMDQYGRVRSYASNPADFGPIPKGWYIVERQTTKAYEHIRINGESRFLVWNSYHSNYVMVSLSSDSGQHAAQCFMVR